MTDQDAPGTEAFSYRATKNRRVQIFRRARLVTTLSGQHATRFLDKAAAADARGLQLLMARATGHFKQGNERASKNAGKGR